MHAPRTVLQFDHRPTPAEIAAALAEQGAIGPAIVFRAVVELASERGTPEIRATVEEILDKIAAMGLMDAFMAAHGTEEGDSR